MIFDNNVINPVCTFSQLLLGETISRDCNKCTCSRRHWTCTQNKCAATCSAIGDPHYKTFDGGEYSFQGACSYILVRHIQDQFLVTAENVACGSSGVTCTKSIFITIGPITIHMMRGSLITVNGVSVKIPRKYGLSSGSLESISEELIIDKAGVFTVVSSFSRGLTVLWDGGTRVYIRLEPINRDMVFGLCGDYNGMLIDEYRTQQGSIEVDIPPFANSWRVSSQCPAVLNRPTTNKCENSERIAWSRKACYLIKSSLFKECHHLVPPEPFYSRCVHDACSCDSGGDCECLCTAIAAYGTECTQYGVSIRWRSQEHCPMQCDYGKVYKTCGDPCEPSCYSIDQPKSQHCSLLGCVEGCFCDDGFVEHNGHCVPVQECPCYIRQGKEGEFPPGTILTQNCQNCTCINGQFDCIGESCNLSSVCDGTEVPCRNGQCIPEYWICDGHDDCIDGSDEENCVQICNEYEHKCNDGFCIPKTFICDGEEDCSDGADESFCTGTTFGFVHQSIPFYFHKFRTPTVTSAL